MNQKEKLIQTFTELSIPYTQQLDGEGNEYIVVPSMDGYENNTNFMFTRGGSFVTAVSGTIPEE